MQGLKRTILVIDDDLNFCRTVADYLGNETVEVVAAHTAADCLDACSRLRVDVALLDQKLPDSEGHLLCPAILGYNDQTKIIFSTAFPSFENAVAAVKAGAYDYLSKPFELGELELAVRKALRVIDLEKVEELQSYSHDKEMEDAVLAGSAGLAEVRRLIERAAAADAPVLITGETGVGKNVVARCIHYSGPWRKAPFVSINCASIPEGLIEAELFGSVKGAFTGASADRKGIFEMADGGTLFLDEIGEMPAHLQTKLLSVLDDKRIKRVGGEAFRRVNVRIISATGVDLENAIKTRTFRKDLYYRLGVIKIHVAPLRERKQDIPELCSHLLSRMAVGRRASVPDTELKLLESYDWPGNVRELRNVLERAAILQPGPSLRPSEFLRAEAAEGVPQSGLTPSSDTTLPIMTLDEAEKRLMETTLTACSGNYTATAAALGISFSTLKRKLRKYGLKDL
jgi:DNA-binding NtrC family response regulator